MKIIETIFLIAVSLFVSACSDSRRAEADVVIAEIEAFQKANGRLPESLSELGIADSEEGPVYYQKEDSISYKIWYGTSLGEAKVFDSTSNSWD